MRTIEEIKTVMCEAFMRDANLANAYGFEVGSAFSSHFSKVSIENLLLYIVAACQYVLEALVKVHYDEVTDMIEAKMVHRPRWYRDKMLAFMTDKVLIADSDEYDTTGMSEAEIESARVVKYAAATESKDSALLTIKVAGEDGGGLCPLDADIQVQLEAYIREIKDAGVRVSLVNQEADLFSCEIDIYYNALKLESSVREAVMKAINGYITGLPFDGVYTNQGLVDVLQVVDGVKIAELKSANVMVFGETTITHIDARHTPMAGYMKSDKVSINMIAYDEQI